MSLCIIVTTTPLLRSDGGGLKIRVLPGRDLVKMFALGVTRFMKCGFNAHTLQSVECWTCRHFLFVLDPLLVVGSMLVEAAKVRCPEPLVP